MKGLDIGYEQLDKGEKIHIKYPIKFYDKYLSKLTKQSHPKERCLIKIYNLRTSFSQKYALKLKNFFYYNFKKTNNDNDLTRFNLEVSQKSKLINFINFDISPIIRFTMGKIFSFKFGHYEANKNQYINNSDCLKNKKNNEIYDFSNVLQSMIPHNRMSFIINKFFPIQEHSVFRIKTTFNKIFNFEDNLKFTHSLISRFAFSLGNLCNIFFSNEMQVKKSFIFNTKSEIKSHHITSGFRCISSLVDMSIAKKDKEISNGFDFIIKNVSTFRFTDFYYFRNIDLLKLVSPYTSIETLLLPQMSSLIHFIYSIGISLKVQENMFIDFSLYTSASKNLPVKNKFINRFRIKFGM